MSDHDAPASGSDPADSPAPTPVPTPTPAPVIAVDGPSGSGKGTLASALAAELGWHLLDSGALYRIVGWAATQRGVDLAAQNALAELAAGLEIQFTPGGVRVDGRLIKDEIRSEGAGLAASTVAAHPAVREALEGVQLDMRKAPGLVADGRDMGTVVFPDAAVKIFLIASAQERARRRQAQLAQRGVEAEYTELLVAIQSRDERDRSRPVSPLVAADDAVTMDSTRLNIDEVIAQALALVRARLPQS